MFHSVPRYFDPFFYLHLASNPFYFNYDPFINSVKTSSNIILVNNETEHSDNKFKESTCLEESSESFELPKSKNKRKSIITQKSQRKLKTQKQVEVKKQKKITKPGKKVDMIQKEGRNSHSNILRKFFKLLSLQTQFCHIVEKIIKKFDFKISTREYFEEVRLKSIDHRNYIRVKEVQCLFEKNQSFINRITRILFDNYLKNYYIEHLLSSKKTDNKSIVFHLKGKRTIKEEILLKKSFQAQCYSDNSSQQY